MRSYKQMEVELGAIVGPLLAVASVLGASALTIFAFKSLSPTQRIMLEQLRREKEELERKAFIQKAAITGGIILLSLIGIKELLKRR